MAGTEFIATTLFEFNWCEHWTLNMDWPFSWMVTVAMVFLGRVTSYSWSRLSLDLLLTPAPTARISLISWLALYFLHLSSKSSPPKHDYYQTLFILGYIRRSWQFIFNINIDSISMCKPITLHSALDSFVLPLGQKYYPYRLRVHLQRSLLWANVSNSE